MVDQPKYKVWTSGELYCGVCSGPFAESSTGVFTNFPQYKNANIANKTNDNYNLEIQSSCTTEVKIYIYKQQMMQMKKKTANIWEYKVGINANIATFVHL